MTAEDLSSWTGLQVGDYILEQVVGRGQIGCVFKARHRQINNQIVACKVILEGGLKDGWQRELQKVALLHGIAEVAPVISSGLAHSADHRPFTYIFYQYVEGQNLKDHLRNGKIIPLPEVEAVLGALLRVLHACQVAGVDHGDLHAGNILISNPDPRIPGSPRRIVVTDFGYGGSHNKIAPKNDRHHVSSIGLDMLNRFRVDDMGPRDRAVRERLIEFFRKDLIETYQQPVSTDPKTQSSQGKIAQSFYELFQERIRKGEREAAKASEGVTENNVDDYLNAEALGHRKEEWQNLFVPEFLGAQSFTSRNVCVITGARGCGKTMAFRRLTLFMDELIGEASGVEGAEGLVGFYLNCRDLIEAFPYIPPRLNGDTRRQLIHFFHLCWVVEFVRALAQRAVREPTDSGWLIRWLEKRFGKQFSDPFIDGQDPLATVRSFLDDQKELCRLERLGKRSTWPLDAIDTLDSFIDAANEGIAWLQGKPLHLFLDDYTIPLLSEQVQAALNPVIFKRRANVFFKVSTEAANSFLRMVGNKPLEENHDFTLVDLANETLHVDSTTKTRLLGSIFERRVKRIEDYAAESLTLKDILGSGFPSFNEHARQLRQQGNSKLNAPLYFGEATFVGMWSSDIRSMIQLFSDLIRQHRSRANSQFPIDRSLQQSRYSESGGEFLNLTDTIRDAGFWDSSGKRGSTSKVFGKTLRNVAQAFIHICRWELIESPMMRNQTGEAPKQAFRLEIIDELELPPDLQTVYNGLLRWHVFMPDFRGRSVRGILTPRIFLNRRLIPYGRLSFSGKDSISLNNLEFQQLLRSRPCKTAAARVSTGLPSVRPSTESLRMRCTDG